jgi:predicted N-acetyltransferase YhbS
MQHGLAEGVRLGFGAAFLFGDPGYYARFGFDNAASLGVSTAEGDNFDAFMGVELAPATRHHEPGRFHEASVFDVSAERLAEFDVQFPARVKHIRAGQFAQ